ncbi:response regulator transcription factor [Pedobacter chitinilyticus]|uniref:Response regulator transcription factor n=2 Tax=Pedobacter chitinilyticus TaxID=2233776 RepID=A0A3S3R9B9_9SPHI|nr:response regulator transcription factor [Pedobacter chitinilyticus]
MNNLNKMKTQPLKCLIVDDELGAVEGIKLYIEKLDFLEVTQVSFSAIEAHHVLKNEKIDLMFLDINMPDLTGLEFLESLNDPPLTIMTTAYSEHALDGFRLNVIDYLLKPIGFQRFFQAVQKAKSAYTSQLTQEVKTLKEEDIYIKQGDTFIRIVWSDILYVEAMQNYVKIHLQDKTHLVHQSMNATVEMLPNSVFFRIHKSYLVNLFHINSINGGRVYVKNYELPLSKYRREELFDTVVNKKLLSK